MTVKNCKLIFTLAHRQSGFSLVATAMMLLMLGLIGGAMMKMFELYESKETVTETQKRVADVSAAMRGFYMRYGRYPCPARLDADIDSLEFGVEVGDDCMSAPLHGTFRSKGRNGKDVRIGAVPARTLGLPDTMMFDGHRKRMIYAVTEAYAVQGAIITDNEGAIRVEDLNGNSATEIPGSVIFLVMSHGEDDNGAYSVEGALLEACDTAKLSGENCDFSSNATFKNSAQTSAVEDSRFTANMHYEVLQCSEQTQRRTECCPDGHIGVFDQTRRSNCPLGGWTSWQPELPPEGVCLPPWPECEAGYFFLSEHYPSSVHTFFGGDISLSGKDLLVGLRGVGRDHEAAYLFTKADNGDWVIEHRFGKPFRNYGTGFGTVVSIHGDVVAIGAPSFPWTGQGRVVIYERDAKSDWTLSGQIDPDIYYEGERDGFGSDVSVYDERVLVGAGGGDIDVNLASLGCNCWYTSCQYKEGKPVDACYRYYETGAAYIIEKGTKGWEIKHKLLASDARPGDGFGGAVDLHDDVAIVGAPSWRDDFYNSFFKNYYSDYRGGRVPTGLSRQGRTYIFRRQADGSWKEEAQLAPRDPKIGGRFGDYVDIEGDLAVVRGNNSYYVFERNADGDWVQLQKLPDMSYSDVKIFDGRILIGQPYYSYEAQSATSSAKIRHQTGRLMLFERSVGGLFEEVHSFVPCPPQYRSDAKMGFAVDFNEETFVGGAPWDDGVGGEKGSVFVFDTLKRPDGC